MNEILHNPVYQALLTGDKQLGFGSKEVKFFAEDVSPFAGFEHDYTKGFSDLYDLLPSGRKILYANPAPVPHPKGWQVQHEIPGLQFIYKGNSFSQTEFPHVKPLSDIHVEQMVQLAHLTKPGPFSSKTINFGSYFGIFTDDKLVAMTGQRLHVENCTEISAVCTHPDHLGKGYAYALLEHQLQIILQQGQLPFLHVREDNARAIAIYKRLGFISSRPMNFYFMKRN